MSQCFASFSFYLHTQVYVYRQITTGKQTVSEADILRKKYRDRKRMEQIMRERERENAGIGGKTDSEIHRDRKRKRISEGVTEKHTYAGISQKIRMLWKR